MTRALKLRTGMVCVLGMLSFAAPWESNCEEPQNTALRPRRPLLQNVKNREEQPSGYLRMTFVSPDGTQVEEVSCLNVDKSGNIGTTKMSMRNNEVLRLPPGEIRMVIVPDKDRQYYCEVGAMVLTNEFTDMVVQLEDLKQEWFAVRTLSEHGNPLPGVYVWCTSMQYKGIWWDGITGLDGKVQLRGVAKGDMVVRAKGKEEGLLLRETNCVVSIIKLAGQTVDISMEKAKVSVAVVVIATNRQDEIRFGKSERVTVELTGMDSTGRKIAQSGCNGVVAFTDLADGTYRVSRVTLPYVPGVETNRYEYHNSIVEEGQVVVVSKENKENRVIRVPRWPNGTGKVIGSVTGVPQMAGKTTEVEVLAQHDSSNPGYIVKGVVTQSGGFRIEKVPPGFYGLEVKVNGEVWARIRSLLVLPGRISGPHVLNIGQVASKKSTVEKRGVR